MKKEIEDRLNLARLLAAKLSGKLTEEKQTELDEQLESDAVLQALVQDLESGISPDKLAETPEKEWKQFQAKYRLSSKRRLWRYVASACAVVLLALGMGLLHMFRNELNHSLASSARSVTLTTESGETYSLEDLHSIQWAEVRQIRIEDRTKEITYAGRQSSLQSAEWHTIQVPAMAEYTLILADGSKVLLNANSRIKYPSQFTDSLREVWLEGEAYFQVARNEKQPFTVHFRENRVTVLGTEFNILCPPGKVARTTLVSGLVLLSNAQQSVVLQPGQEGILLAGESDITVQAADINVAIAWTHNKFYFKNQPLEEIVRKLSEWYDVKILFQENDLRQLKFTIESNRYNNISEVLEIIKATGRINYTQQGNTILLSR